MKRWLVLAALAALAIAGGGADPAGAATGRPLVIAIRLNSEINPVSASFVSDSIDRARSDHAAALVILLDTPVWAAYYEQSVISLTNSLFHNADSHVERG